MNDILLPTCSFNLLILHTENPILNLLQSICNTDEMSTSNSSISDDKPLVAKKSKTCFWETIPDEIREKIYKELDLLGPDGVVDIHLSNSNFRRNHEMPALIVALRELPVSYGHVLDWFSRVNSHLVVYFDPEDSDLDMTPAELEVVESAELISL